jgi:N-dimethylarginine dimethylaminohydrolase
VNWSIDSETAPLRAVLLCPPDHYKWIPTNAIARETLEEQSVFDREGARAQFGELVSALEGEGVECRYLAPEPHLPYQVYTRDSSQTVPWGTVLTQLSLPERRGEIGGVLSFYGPQGGFWKVSTHGAIEGGDIHLIRPGLGAIGWSGVRTTLAAAREFAGWFEAEGWEMRLEPFAEHFLHLDVLFCMAADGIAVACIEVLGEDFAGWLGRHGIRIVEASYREVMAMSCNVLALGDGKVLSPRHSGRLNAALRAEGLTVLDPALDIFARGGGSVHCMTMPLRRDAGTVP